MKQKLQIVVCLLLLLICGTGNAMAQSQQQEYAVFEQNGLYYAIDLSNKRAFVIEGALAIWYIDHNGDLSGYDYSVQHEILPGYKGSVTIPASVTYQNEVYPITDVSGFSNNPELTALRVEPGISSIYLDHVENLTSLELVNTEYLTSMSLHYTSLTSLFIPANVYSVSFSGNSKLINIKVDPENKNFTMSQGVLCNKNSDGNPPTQLIYVPEGMEGKLVIPEGITYCNNSLAGCTKLTEVVIPSTFYAYNISTLLDGVRNLKVSFSGENPAYKNVEGFILSADGNNLIYAFGSDTESLTIPDGVQTISDSGMFYFYGSTRFPKLKTLTLPASFTQDIFSMLHDCYTLEQVIIKSGNKYYTSVNGMVMDNTRRTLLFVPNNFQGSLTIPEGTFTIGREAFRNSQRLTSINIPNTVTSIGSNAFRECYNLVSATLPSSLEKIEDGVFSSCTKLESVDIPQSLKVLGTSMFASCASLKTVALPNVTLIPSYLFSYCKNLESITIPQTVTVISNNAFDNCVKLKEIQLPEGLQTIYSCAFQGDSALVSLTIPASVTQIDYAITRYCPQIEQIKVAPNNSTYCDIDGVIFSKDQKTLVQFPAGRKGNYTIPTGTNTIGRYGFYQCDSLKQVIVPEGVQQLEEYAFGLLPSLTELDFPASMTSTKSSSLYSLSNLKRLILRTSEQLYSYNVLSYLYPNSECVVYVDDKNFDNFKSYSTSSNIICMSISKPYGICSVKKYIKGLGFKLVENELMSNTKNLVSITSGNRSAVKQEDGTYLIKGLKSGANHTLDVNYQIDAQPGTISYGTYYTNSPGYKVNGAATQTTCTITSAYFRKYVDVTTGTPKKMSITIQGQDYACNENGYAIGAPFEFTGLQPQTSVPVIFKIQYEDGEELTMNSSLRTQGYNASLTGYKVTPTTLRLEYTYNEIDAVPDSILIATYERIQTGTYSYQYKNVYDTLRTSVKDNLFTSLVPGKKYTVQGVFLKNKINDKSTYTSISNYYNIISTFETPAFSIETETPKIPERGRAVVSAKTNAGDGEGHVGFQWIRYDAPSTMQPYEAYGQVYSGVAQGQLKNLNTERFYKVRAFYDCSDGTRIYAQNGIDNGWVTFDPSETSTFETVVHTYGEPTTTNTTVILVAIMIEGSESVIEQGFEYWELATSEASTRTVRRVGATRETQTVLITGDNLTAELTGLIPGTEYGYRAFAKTATGIVYGEERTFKTNGVRPVETAIEEVASETAEPETFNVYTVSGAMVRHQATSLDGLPRGFYIVNKRKVFVK